MSEFTITPINCSPSAEPESQSKQDSPVEEAEVLFSKSGHIATTLKEIVASATEPTSDVTASDAANASLADTAILRPFIPPKRPFSTTSSVYVDRTILNPDFQQVNYCIAAILQAQVFDDMMRYGSLTEDDINVMTEFHLNVHLPAECGGEMEHIPPQILQRETWNDMELYHRIVNHQVPTIETIYRFITMIYSSCKYSLECHILALIYINRIVNNKHDHKHHIVLSYQNWRGFWMACVVLAQKIWDDVHLKTSAFVNLLPNIHKSQLINMEIRTLELLNFATIVKPSVYVKYYFELRQLFNEIVGNNSNVDQEWKTQPLSHADGKRLEMRSSMQFKVRRDDGSPSNTSACVTPMRVNSASTNASSNSSSTASAASSSHSRSLVPPKGMIAKPQPFKPPKQKSHRSKTVEDLSPTPSNTRHVIN